MSAIAVVGLACRYPEAGSPQELWENVLSQRRSFRQLPPERLRLEDYYDTSPSAVDSIDTRYAALLEDWEFDRVAFKISGSTFRATDLTHWLAVEVARDLLETLGADDGESGPAGVSRDRVAVVMGNTLTGEFARTGVLRLRWPFVRRMVAGKLLDAGFSEAQAAQFLEELERDYKAPFPAPDEDSLAGALSNTIAGRICNLFDFRGGGYTIDGACASSLLAVINGCGLLLGGEADLVLAGGVDLSIDPLELVGFARTGALARDTMRVFDERSEGFWPGEGCGLIALMRLPDALAEGIAVQAVIRGWGVSSDGRGGMTRPEVGGQLLAIQRAYARAGYGPESVALFEAHGTGTAVGDPVEIRSLSQARALGAASAAPAALGSIKANIGHTKAAAGAAALIKSVLSLQHGVLPPTTGCERPHPELVRAEAQLRVLASPEPWPEDMPIRAGVSGVGFGGINSHVTLEAFDPAASIPVNAGAQAGNGMPVGVAERAGLASPLRTRRGLTRREQRLAATPQDTELIALTASTAAELAEQAGALADAAERISFGQMRDVAIQACRRTEELPVRAVILASSPLELAERLRGVRSALENGRERSLDISRGYLLAAAAHRPRIGYLFPGQAAPTYLSGGAMAQRFPVAREWLAQLPRERVSDLRDTRIAQPAIVACSLAALQILERIGVRADVAVGHSLGELVALHWAGAYSDRDLLALAAARGQAMGSCNGRPGAMANLRADADAVNRLSTGLEVGVAALNAADHTVVSGPASDVDAVLSRARGEGIDGMRLPVSHAFHSPLVAAAAAPLRRFLEDLSLRPLQQRVVSTVEGRPLSPDVDIAELLVRQITEPVRFAAAAAVAGPDLDLWIEVGPGAMLSELLRGGATPRISTDAGGPSLSGLLGAIGGAWALGADVDLAALAEARLERDAEPLRQQRFLANPCERAPVESAALASTPAGAAPPAASERRDPEETGLGAESPDAGALAPEEVVRRLIARRAELPLEAVSAEARLLTDLNLNSIAIAEIAVEAARELGVAPPTAPEGFADATLAEIARVLADAPPDDGSGGGAPAGVGAWLAPFVVRWVPRSSASGERCECAWDVISAPGHPLADAVTEALSGSGTRRGAAILPSPERTTESAAWLCSAVRDALGSGRYERILFIHGGQAGAIARTAFLEHPQLSVRAIEIEGPPTDAALALVRQEAETGEGYREARLLGDGRWLEPQLERIELGAAGEPRAVPERRAGGQKSPVLLATGAGKGIGAEAALALALHTGARVGIVGRSSPADDAELAANLDRVRQAGVEMVYVQADVSEKEQCRHAVEQVGQRLGAITHVLHAAGVNQPSLLSDLSAELVASTLAPKLGGFSNLVAVLDRQALEMVIAFGSIIARTGLRGEGHYGLANEWLRQAVEELAEELPNALVSTLEWSVWGGVGMGERLGRVEALARAGVTAIAPEDGKRMLLAVAEASRAPAAIVATGRFGNPPTLRLAPTDLPLLRFLERVPVHYPGVELVADCSISVDTDRYLLEHALDGVPLLPAVVGLEAMAQIANALSPGAIERIEHVRLTRPVTAPASGERRVRIAAVRREPGTVDAVLRTEETSFGVDHFAARFQLAPGGSPCADERPLAAPAQRGQDDVIAVPDTVEEVYQRLLFHGPRFRRVRRYRHLSARRCEVDISVEPDGDWFSQYLPSTLILGDVGARDAYIHAAQACIPHRRVLPVSVERIEFNRVPARGRVRVSATQRWATAAELAYDIVVCDDDGSELEVWSGLVLRAVDELSAPTAWRLELLRPYLERRVAELVPDALLDVAVVDGGAQRRSRSALAAQQVAPGAQLANHANGKPELEDGREVSISHSDPYTLAVCGERALACDLQAVEAREPQIWTGLLGEAGAELARQAASESNEGFDFAATRLWVVGECLRKAGRPSGEPIVLDRAESDRWMLFRCGELAIATALIALPPARPTIVGILARTGGP